MYIDAYYNQGLSMQRIAELYGVNKSTVSKVISAGMGKFQVWLEDKVLVSACILEDGEIKWDKLLREVVSLPEQQRKLLAMMRTGRFPTYQSLADWLALDKSSVTRTISRGVRNLVRLGIPANQFEWLRIQERELRKKGVFSHAGTQGNHGCAGQGLAGGVPFVKRNPGPISASRPVGGLPRVGP